MGEIITEGGLSVLPGGTYSGVSQGRSRCSDPDTRLDEKHVIILWPKYRTTES